MKIFLLKVYSWLPYLLQNLVVSLQGYRLQKSRQDSHFRQVLQVSIGRLEKTEAELNEYQLEELRRFLQYAYTHSEYYKRVMDEAGFSPLGLVSSDDLKQLPVLEKSILQKEQDRVLTVSKSKLLSKGSTSGTTGRPLQTGYIPQDIQSRFALLYRMFGAHGFYDGDSSARFSGGVFFAGSDRNKKFWRHNYARNQLFMSSYHLKEENLGYYIDKLTDFQPKLIDGYPSAIFLLSQGILAAGAEGKIKTSLIACTGETLEPHQKELIERAFPYARVINQYASAEGAPLITENAEGELVMNIDSGVFEMVRPGTTEPALPGEIAELLVTSFHTHAYPLIRYRIGDTVLVSDQVSKTWKMPVVEGIFGRRDDLVYTTERGWVGRLSPALKTAPASVLEAQVEQLQRDRFVLRLVVAEAYKDGDARVVVQELKSRLGDVVIDIELHKSYLPRGKNGKLRAVIGLPNADK